MAELLLTIGGRTHRVACRDGGEAELTAAAELLDEQARSLAGMGAGEARTLLLAGLLVADRLREERLSRSSPQPPPDTPVLESRLAELVARVEALAADGPRA